MSFILSNFSKGNFNAHIFCHLCKGRRWFSPRGAAEVVPHPILPWETPSPGFLPGWGRISSPCRGRVIALAVWADPSKGTWWCFPRGGWFGSTADEWPGAVKTAFLGCECTCLPVPRRPCSESSRTGKVCLFQENPQFSVSNMLIF